MQERGSASPVPVWGAPATVPVRRRGSWWATAAIVVAATGFVAASVGALLGAAALLGTGLIHAASQGEAGTGWLFREITRIGDFFVVIPLAVIAAACTVAAWRRTRGPDRSRASTIVATVMTSSLVLLASITALLVI